MASCPPCEPPANDCYPVEHPCTIYAKLENALVTAVTQGRMTGYRVGEESFQYGGFASLEELRAERDRYHALCAACGGCPPPIAISRPRARICFVPGDHRCRLCGASSCGCRK